MSFARFRTPGLGIVLFVLVTLLPGGEFSSTGLRIGINSSQFRGADIPGRGQEPQTGLSIGGFFNYKLNGRYSIQQELYIISKGARINTIGDVYQTNLLFYLECPVLVKKTFTSDSAIKPFVLIGPAAARKWFAMNNTGLIPKIRDFDLGLVFGYGFEFRRLDFDLRYNHGLLGFDQSDEDIDLRNSSWTVMLGYHFN